MKVPDIFKITETMICRICQRDKDVACFETWKRKYVQDSGHLITYQGISKICLKCKYKRGKDKAKERKILKSYGR